MTDGESWDGALADLVEIPPLLQTWAWGEVQAHAGWRVERVRLKSGCASVLVGGGRWRHGYVPRGPVPVTAAVVSELVEWGRAAGLVRLRVEPETGAGFADELAAAGFRPRPDASPQQPVHTSIVELRGPADELLTGFKPKTRYNIRLAERRGVRVTAGSDAAELVRQVAATERRQGIQLPPGNYYRHLLELLPWCRIYVAAHEGDALAAILVARHAGRAYYLFGGSNGVKRELMPMYAAQWAAIREAALDGLREYDLWGVPPADDPSHPWHGLHQFKAGFNGRAVEYVGSWEVDLAPAGAAMLDRLRAVRSVAGRLKHIFSTSANVSSV